MRHCRFNDQISKAQDVLGRFQISNDNHVSLGRLVCCSMSDCPALSHPLPDSVFPLHTYSNGESHTHAAAVKIAFKYSNSFEMELSRDGSSASILSKVTGESYEHAAMEIMAVVKGRSVGHHRCPDTCGVRQCAL